MADDPNKSNKPVNGSSRPLNGKSKIERIQTRRESDVGEYTSRQEELEAAIAREESRFQDYESQYNKTKDQGLRAVLNAKMTVQAERHAQAEERLSTYEMSHARKVNAQAAQEIATYTKYENVNARTTTMAGSQKYYSQIRQDQRAGGDLLQTPTEAIEHRIRMNQGRVATLGKELAGSTRGLGYDDWSDDMKAKNAAIERLQEETARDKRLLKVQSKEGMTTEKRQYAARDVLARSGSILGQKQLAEDVRGGKYGSLESETERLGKLFEKLSAASERFEEASQNATDAQGNLTKEYKEASKALDGLQKATDQQSKIVNEVGRQGGGTIGQRFSSAATGFNRAANIGYAIDIDDEISEMRLKSGMGRRAVQQYDRSNAAISGDMSALLREASAGSFVTEFSDKIRSREMRRAALTITAGGENAVGNIIDNVGGAISGKGKGGRLAKLGRGLKGLGSDTAIGVAEMARSTAQLARGIPQTAKALEAGFAADDFAETMLAIPSKSTQSFYDNYMAQSGATMGLGARAADMQWQMTNVSNLQTMAELGISPGRSAQLSAQGVRQLGAAQDIPGMIQMAGRIEQSRLMSADQFMGMQGQLTDVGAGTFDLETIMKNAVAAGMDNAKNIQQMVNATQQMASGLSKSGVSGAGAAGNILGVGVQRLRNLGVDANIATQAAQFANESQKKFSQDISMDLGTVHETNRIKDIAPGIDETYQMRIASMSQAQMQAIISGGRDAADKFGLGSVYDKVGKQGFKDFARADLESSFYKVDGHIMMSAKERKQFFGAVQSGDMSAVPDKFRALYSTMTGGAEFRGIGVAGMDAKEGKLPDPQLDNLEKQKQLEAQRKVQEIRMGGGKDPDQKMDKLISIMETMVKVLTPEQAQDNVRERAKDMDEVQPIVQAGDTFNKGSKQFKQAVDEFDRILKRVDLTKQQTGGIQLKKVEGGNSNKAGRR